jgi:rhodanese-related sulfurtransferase
MKPSSHTPKFQDWHILSALCLIVACLGVCSCADSQEKTIPALDPSLSTVKPTAPVIKAPLQPGTITPIPLGNLYQLVQSKAALIFDVRPVIFYKLGHIPGAVSFPKADFDKDIEKHEARIEKAITNHNPVVIYCTDLACPDALTVATQLSQRGYNVAVLQGGYEAWKNATD